jgi:hypothetical protein
MEYAENSKPMETPKIQIDEKILSESVARLRAELEGLEARLELVLIPSAPAVNQISVPAGISVNPSSVLSNRLRASIAEIDKACNTIASIKSRLEI